MSTRARVVIRDSETGEENYLYRGMDGYIEGLGVDLVDACDKFAAAPDFDSFTMKLLKADIALESDIFGEDACLNWVFFVDFKVNHLIPISASHVKCNCDHNLTLRERLEDPIDVRKAVAEYRERVRLCKIMEDELRSKFGRCPFCGGRPDLTIYGDDSIHLRCFNVHCPNSETIVTSSEEEALRLWHLRNSHEIRSTYYNKWIEQQRGYLR